MFENRWFSNLFFSSHKEEKGYWIKDEFGSKCSCCGKYAYRDKFDRPWESPYCPICGAKMQEVEDGNK